MKKKVLYFAFVLMLFSLGSSTFTSCGKDDDDTASRVDTIYMVNKDTVYINNGTSNSTTLGVYAMGWIDLTIKDMDGEIVLQKKIGQNLDSWGGYIEESNVSLNINGVENKNYSGLSKGTYKIDNYGSEFGTLTFFIFDDAILNSLSPLGNQKHNITKVEKIGQFIDGNYLYAIEGNFDIKMSKNGGSPASYMAKCNYRIIVESDFYAEN